MRVEYRTYFWKPEYPVRVFVVKKWRWFYRYFNLLFAKASSRWEMMICQEGD